MTPLTENNIGVEEIYVDVPGMTEEYHILCLADMHILLDSEEVQDSEKATIADRIRGFSHDGLTSAELWETLPQILDACHADAVLFCGDMVDTCSVANMECLKAGLDALETPYLYARADHDTSPWWLESLDERSMAMHVELDGNPEVSFLEFPEFCVAMLSNSTSQISADGLSQMREIFALGKPIILATHVPYVPLSSDDLAQRSKEAWGDRVLLWGEGCAYSPDENTGALMDMIYAEDSPVKEVICGHLHFEWDGALTEGTHEHVLSPAFERKVGVITIGDKEANHDTE